jgi:NADPH-dependent curcumin reductase CurA
MPKIVREIHLVKRPSGLPGPDSFKLVERPLAEPKSGQLIVRNLWISVDPYMRGRMSDKKSFIPPFALNEVMEGAAVGIVEESRDPAFKPGDTVSHFAGWRDLALIDAAGAALVDPSFPLQAYLGPLGFPGLAAYAGFLRLGEPKPGETVFVSAAAGAVGSLVAQIARIKGNRVIASAGSPDKIDWLLKEAGVDQVINYKTEKDITAALAKAAPNGIDIYFDNVGGDHLEAAIANANDFARFTLCGMIAQYNAEPVGPRNIYAVIEKSLKLQGFIASNHLDLSPDFQRDMKQWITDGRIKWKETVVAGLENSPKAFLDIFAGANAGKMLVKLV